MKFTVCANGAEYMVDALRFECIEGNRFQFFDELTQVAMFDGVTLIKRHNPISDERFIESLAYEVFRLVLKKLKS